MTLQFKSAARADLRTLRHWSEAIWGDTQTRKYLTGMKNALDRLEREPEIGRQQDVLIQGLRSWRFKSHVIFYTQTGDAVTVIRVLHERQNATALAFAAQLEK